LRRQSISAPAPFEDTGAKPLLEIAGSAPSLVGELASNGVTQISDLSFAAVESILRQVEENLFEVSNDDFIACSVRNQDASCADEAATLDRELSMEGANARNSISKGRADLGTGLEQFAHRRNQNAANLPSGARLLSPRKPGRSGERTRPRGAVDIGGLDAGGLQRISALVRYNELKVSPAQHRQLVRRRKELQGPRKTLAEELAAEGVTAIDALDLEGVKRIIELVEGNELKVEAGQLSELYSREEKVSQDPLERITLVKELIQAPADSIAELDLDDVERIINLIEGGKLTVDADQLRELYQRDAQLSEDILDKTEQSEESTLRRRESGGPIGTTISPDIQDAPTGRMRSNAVVGRTIGGELARLGVPDIDSLDLPAVRRLIGLVEDGGLKVETGHTASFTGDRAALEPESVDVTVDEDETPLVPRRWRTTASSKTGRIYAHDRRELDVRPVEKRFLF
jgi:hypothetical protein